MRRTRSLVCAALLTLLPAAAHAQEQPGERLSSLLEGRVTFALPPSWVLESHVNTKASGRALLKVPNPAADQTRRSNAILTAKVVPENINVRHESDGDDWRTMVWTFKDGVPYVVLNRFGLVGRVSVELVVVFPAGGSDPKWVEQAVADFNAVCASLKIDGRTKFDSHVKTDKLPQPRKVNPKP